MDARGAHARGQVWLLARGSPSAAWGRGPRLARGPATKAGRRQPGSRAQRGAGGGRSDDRSGG